ncbi:MAG: ABC transporter substrate-binding protein [Promethearchaeota archaeon]
MKNKNVTSWIILFSIFFQFLVGLTYFNPNLGNKNNVDILDLEPSDVILGNYTFPGTSGPVYLNESIKIGLLGDLEDPTGDHNWKGALLAAKEINEGGGIDIYSNGTYYYVGLVAEDTDETNETLDVMKGVEAANKIISYDPHAIIGGNNNDSVSAYIEPIMDAKIPFLGTGNAANEFCQNVQNNYNRYKYFFRVSPLNSTMIGTDVLYQLAFTIINLNGTYDGWFKNVTVLRDNVSWTEGMSSAIKSSLPAIVSGITSGNIVLNTINEYNISTSVTYSEMTDIWNQVNRSMAQLVVPIFSSNASIIVSQTYGDVKPMCLMEGIDIASAIDDFWDNTEGGCQYEIMTHTLYDSSIPFFNDYVEEYNINPLYTAVGAYDAVYMLTNVSLSSQSLKADDIITGMEGFNRANPFIGPGGRIAFWDNTHELVAGYPYAYSRWCQWHLDGTKVVIPSSYSAYPPSIATGSLILPYWGIHNLVAPQDIPANFILSSYADPIDTDGTFELTWSNSTGADNYSVYLFDRNISYISKRYVLNSYENKTSPFTIFGLKTGEYYCIVAAYNETGERLSNTVYVNVERPRPGIFTLTIDADIPVDTDGDFILNWTVSEGADNYSIFESKSFITVINDSVTNIANQTTNTPLTITGLIDGDYFYAVMAYNETGERLSNNVFIKVRKPPGQFILSSDAEVPVGTDIFVDTDGNFNLTWTTSLRATNYTIFQSPNYITIINGNSTPIGIVQAINSSYEITGLNIGIYYYIIRAFNGYNYTISNCIEVNIQFYDAMTGYWELAPLVIEDTDNENFNWSEVVAFPWCSGSGTLGAPYIIEFIQIDGNNISDCICIIISLIRN